MRGLLMIVMALVALSTSPAARAQSGGVAAQAASADDEGFYAFLRSGQGRPATAKEFRQQVQDACGAYPLRPSGVHGGDNIQGRNGDGGICAVLVLSCKACGQGGKPAFIVSGVEGIVVGQMDMAANDRLLTRGFGRLFRVMGELCGDYRFDAFADGFLKSQDGEAALVGVYGVKDYGSELRPKPGKTAPAKSVIPGRYFDPSTYSNRCQKA
jgi:hypothetical protein